MIRNINICPSDYSNLYRFYSHKCDCAITGAISRTNNGTFCRTHRFTNTLTNTYSNTRTESTIGTTSVSILQNSVANASQVRPSEVTLLSYTATAARLSESDALALTAESQNEDSFFPALRRLFSEQSSIYENHRSIRMSTQATNSYTIRAICAIRVALADYPQFNGNITALYTTLTNNLLQAVSDNSLVNTIRILSVQANSVTFQFINGVEVLEITLPLAEGFPTAMPTIAPDDDISGPDYSTGEIAGMIIAVMVLLALFVIGMYYLITYRKPDRSEVYLYVEPTQMDTLMNSPVRSGN
eukprot:gene21802-24723_t